MRIEINKPHVLARLRDELTEAGVDPAAIVVGDGKRGYVELQEDDEQEAAARAAIAAHDAAAVTAELQAELQARELATANEATLRDRALQAIDTLEQAWAGWGSLTAAQKDATAKLNVRVTVALARLVLRRLDKS